VKRRNPGQEEAIIEVTLIPETWIIAPLVTEQQLRRWYEKGWINDEDLHLDRSAGWLTHPHSPGRAFPRSADGRPIIFKLWLLAPMKRACDKLGYSRSVLGFSIIDDHGFPVEYVEIPDQPLKYRRVILGPKQSTEYFEYIDSTYELKFRVKTRYPKEFCEILNAAGRIGLMARSGKGFGKFRVSFKVETLKNQ